MAEKDDDRELMAKEIARMKPAREMLGDKAVEALKSARLPGQRGPQKAPTKEQVTVRLDRDVLDELRAGGAKWQPRMNELLRKALKLDG